MRNIILSLVFLLFLISPLSLASEEWRVSSQVTYPIIGLFIILFLLYYKKQFLVNYKTFSLVFLFVFFSGISALVNSDIQLLNSIVSVFFLYIITFIITPTLLNKNVNKFIYIALAISQVIIVFFPLILYGIDTQPYRGIFNNPNSLGVTAVTLFSVFVSTFLYNIEIYIYQGNKDNKAFINICFMLILLLASLFFIILSGSRTSLVTAFLVLLIGFIYVSYFLIKSKKIVSFFYRGILTTIAVSFLTIISIKYTPFYNFFYINIIEKFQKKAGSGSILANRDQIWIKVMDEAGIFGNGSNYFNDFMSIGSHNTFIDVLGRFGWIPLLPFIALIFMFVVTSIQYSLLNIKDEYKYLPLTLTFCFLFLSMGENMFSQLSMVAMFFVVGSIDSKKKVNTFVYTGKFINK